MPRLRDASSSLCDFGDGVLEDSREGVALLVSRDRRDISCSNMVILKSEDSPLKVGEGARVLAFAGLQRDPVLTQFEHEGWTRSHLIRRALHLEQAKTFLRLVIVGASLLGTILAG